MAHPRLFRLREQCRAFRECLPAEQQAAFDGLLRDASAAVKAGAALVDLPIEGALALALALHEQLSEVEGRLSALERSR